MARTRNKLKNYRNKWLVCGKNINKLTYLAWLEENGMDINNLSPEDEMLIRMRFGD